jgi:phosphoribosylanthranilate isomerase
MNIKVCGITQLKQLQQLEAMEIDYAGLIFYADSPRYVVDLLKPKELKNADFELQKVGVFVNASYDEIMEQVDAYDLNMVQLHGDESPELCEDLSDEVEVIKAFRVGAGDNIDQLVADYDAVCDFYLFDTKGETAGGTGKQFDWTVLEKAKIEKPFFLSGGIGLEDVDRIRKMKHVDFFAVDINSRFEVSPGVKDIKQVLQFKAAFR